MPGALRILIVGGGIAGLGLCRALLQRKIVPDIVERAASWPSSGTGLYIPGNGVRALKDLGLADRVLARAVCMSHQRVLDHTGRQLAEIELAQVWSAVGPCVGIARGELHRILLESTAGIPIRLGTSVTGLRQHDDKVDVVFTNGSTGRYDLVVGADGIHSRVRQLLVGDITPRHLGQLSWRFLVDFSGAIDTWTVMLGPTGIARKARREPSITVQVSIAPEKSTRNRQLTWPRCRGGKLPNRSRRIPEWIPSAPTTRTYVPVEPSVNDTVTLSSCWPSPATDVPSRTGTPAVLSRSTR